MFWGFKLSFVVDILAFFWLGNLLGYLLKNLAIFFANLLVTLLPGKRVTKKKKSFVTLILVDFLTTVGWGAIKILSSMDEFRNLDRDIETNAKRWKKFVEAECPEKVGLRLTIDIK